MPIIELEELTVQYGPIIACQGVNLLIEANQVIGLIGQSGSGKSSVAKALLHLHEEANVRYKKLQFCGLDYTTQIKRIRPSIAWIPQDPNAALCEHLTIQTQLTDQMRFVQKLSKKAAIQKALEMMKLVDISQPLARLKQYPHQLSGGIKQRLLIAMALCQNPRLIIADELTASLDTLNKASIAKLILEIQRKKQLSFLIISHDINFIQAICEKTVVMYAGQVVEIAPTKQLFRSPKHPYTQDLLNTTYTLTHEAKKSFQLSTNFCQSGCKYQTNCQYKMQQCHTEDPKLMLSEQSQVRCLLYEPKRVSDETYSEITQR